MSNICLPLCRGRPLITDDTVLPLCFHSYCRHNCCVSFIGDWRFESHSSGKRTISCVILQLECVGRWTAIHEKESTWQSACCTVVMWYPRTWTQPSPWLRRRKQFSLLNGALQVLRQAVWCLSVHVCALSDCYRENVFAPVCIHCDTFSYFLWVNPLSNVMEGFLCLKYSAQVFYCKPCTNNLLMYSKVQQCFFIDCLQA